MEAERDALFSEDDIISSYPAEQAVEDGYLVALKGAEPGHPNFVTRAVWNWLEEWAPTLDGPPANWPVSLLLWFSDHRVLAMAVGLIDVNGPAARRQYEDNRDGGIWKEDHGGRTLWLIPNECGGLTLMFPEDY